MTGHILMIVDITWTASIWRKYKSRSWTFLIWRPLAEQAQSIISLYLDRNPCHSSIYLSIIQSPTSSLSAILVIMLLDFNWQYAFIALLLHPTSTLCKGSSSRSGSCTWKICGWLGLGLFVGVLVLVVFCACASSRDAEGDEPMEPQAEGGRGTAMTGV